MTSGEAIRLLRDAGYELFKISKGAHWVFIHPSAPQEWVIVPMHGKKELTRAVEAVFARL